MRKLVAAIVGAAIAGTAAAGCASSATGKTAPQTAAPLTAAEQRLAHDHFPRPWARISPRAFYAGDRVTSAAYGIGQMEDGAGPLPGMGPGPIGEEVIVSVTAQAAARLSRELTVSCDSAGVNRPWQVNAGDRLTGTLVIAGTPAGMAEFNKLVLSIRPVVAP